jgi:hypothetical protein
MNNNLVNYSPEEVFESPFLNADYGSGIVISPKGKRRKVLDFRNASSE